MDKRYKNQISGDGRKITAKEKAVCRIRIKKTGLKLRKAQLLPENLFYVTIYHDACALAGLGQYKLAAGICRVLEGHLDTVLH